MAGDSGGSVKDPYATDKANLRDTIKWLAGIFGALAAAVIAGTPLSGVGALPITEPRFWLAGFLLLLSFVCICAALVFTLRLLRSDLLYLSNIDPRSTIRADENEQEIQAIRKALIERRQDLYPEYKSLEHLFETLAEADAAANQLGKDWTALDEQVPRDEVAIKSARDQYDLQIAQIQGFRDLQQELLAYASYRRFYGRLRRATPLVIGLGILALIGLMGFTVVAQRPKESKGPEVVVVPLAPAEPGSPPSAATRVSLGEVTFSSGSARVEPSHFSTLQRARDALALKPDAILLLMARTDTVAGAKLNSSLAHQRAEAVRAHLIGAGGIAASRIFAAELPETALPQVTDQAVASQSNRSVSLHLLHLQR